MAKTHIERFDKTRHDRASFSCGVPSLDQFLHQYVSQYEKRRLGRTYVAVDEQGIVLGYYTLTASAIEFDEVSKEIQKNLPKHPIPCLLIARLAVDHTVHGKGMGWELLSDALRNCWELSERAGIHLIKVEAIDEKAAAFYQKHGFSQLPNNPLQLVLHMETVHKLITSKK